MHRNDTPARAEIPPGTLSMLILKTLSMGPLHGYAIVREIRRQSDDVLQVEEGSLYPAQQRILRSGWASAEWVPAGPRRRARVYRLTPAGRKKLAAEVTEFARVTDAILRVVRPAEA